MVCVSRNKGGEGCVSRGREGGGHLDDIAWVTCIALRIRVDEIK